MADPFIHPTAIVDEGASIGADTRIWHFVHVCSGASLGQRCVLGQNVFVGPGVRIGNGVKIQNNVSVYKGVVLGDDVFLGPSCVFTNVLNPRAHIERKDEFSETNVACGVTVGANATIVCGSQLGEYAFVGAGSVVTKDVPPHALVFGNPARIQGWMCQCGERLPAGAAPSCKRCGASYAVDDQQCVRTEAK